MLMVTGMLGLSACIKEIKEFGGKLGKLY